MLVTLQSTDISAIEMYVPKDLQLAAKRPGLITIMYFIYHDQIHTAV
jgi:hypothetical protein